MSVVLQLFKYVDDVEIDEYNSVCSFSDKRKHDFINLNFYKNVCKHCCPKKSSYKFIKKITEGHSVKTSSFITLIPNLNYEREVKVIFNYIVVDEILYMQGSFFKNRFFNRKFPIYFIRTKKEMENFFDKYLDYTKKEAVECKNKFLNFWEDGMLFKCSW